MKNFFRLIMTVVVFWHGILLVPNVKAGVISYPSSGAMNTDLYTFAATSTGQINAYFFGSSAAYTNTLTMLVNGVVTPQTATGVLNNHTSNMGDFINLGFVNAGDVLTFQLNVVTTGKTWYSDESLNSDGTNHVYSAAFSGDSLNNIPAGTYVGFEDLYRGGDLDYNDEIFVFTNMSVSPVPEPETYAMLLAGLVLVSFRLHRRKTESMVGC